MDLHNSFTVPADLDTAWGALLDVEKMAPCMPGATLERVDGDDFTGSVKVKLGPVSIVYAGKAKFVSKDATGHVAVIEGTGKEARGSGSAKAAVTVRLAPESAARTRVDVATELTITGKAAQFGGGVMQDVAGRIIDQFAANLSDLMGAPETAEPSPVERTEGTDAVAGAAGGTAGSRDALRADAAADQPLRIAGSATSSGVGVASSQRPASKSADSINLLSTASVPVLKRVVPLVVGVAAVVGVLWWLIKR